MRAGAGSRPSGIRGEIDEADKKWRKDREKSQKSSGIVHGPLSSIL